MNISKTIYILIAVVVILALFANGYFLYLNAIKEPSQVFCTQDAKICPDGSAVGRIAPNCEFAQCPEQEPPSADKSDLITVANIEANQLISSPQVIRGEARGTWFFEASFPISLLDAQGNELTVAIATAQSDWMTTDFVPFEATLTFAVPTSTTGVLVLRKDNPSGLPEHDDKLLLPIRFSR